MIFHDSSTGVLLSIFCTSVFKNSPRLCQSALLYSQILCGAFFLQFILMDISVRTQLWLLIPGKTSVLITRSWMFVAMRSRVFASLVGSFTSWTRPLSFRNALNSSWSLTCWQDGFNSGNTQNGPKRNWPKKKMANRDIGLEKNRP